jgi:Zn-dependent alcohol dehydrogenase
VVRGARGCKYLSLFAATRSLIYLQAYIPLFVSSAVDPTTIFEITNTVLHRHLAGTNKMLSGYDSTTAIVAREPVHGHVNWKLENVSLREIKADELLIRLIATGICHTDLSFSTLPPEVSHYPKILGHEGRYLSADGQNVETNYRIGAGYVQRTGSSVKGIKVGDPVLLSFAFCSSCRDCSEEHVSYCQQSATINHGEQNVFLPTEGPPASGLFFGQSSFSNLAIVKETSAINISGLVRNDEEMKLFAPLGCSVQTGMGTVKELARAGKNDLVLILGLGGVGLAAIMVCIALVAETQLLIIVGRKNERLFMHHWSG